jgi:hypothetical protein
VRRSLAAVVAAAASLGAMAAALALTAGTAPAPVGSAPGPVSSAPTPAWPEGGSSGVPPSIVLEAATGRPAERFEVRTMTGIDVAGSAQVRWSPRGGDVCPRALVPLGGRGTDVQVQIETDRPSAGSIRGSLYAPHAPCTRAVGTWRGTGGDYTGRDGGLVVALDEDGVVRMVFSP